MGCKVPFPAGYSIMAENASGLHTRPTLLLRLRDPRDVQAWNTFVEVYGPLVYKHCCARGLQHSDAEDVTQRVFVRVIQAIRTFDYQPDLGRFRDWLGRIVRNEVNRFFKQKSRHPDGSCTEADSLDQLAAPAEDGLWAAEFHARLLQVALTRARLRFEADTWRAFERVWLEHGPAEQVAQELGRTLDWVYVAKCRVLKQLWQEVQALADEAGLFSCSQRGS